jgi:ribose transport system substrate-binding protein
MIDQGKYIFWRRKMTTSKKTVLIALTMVLCLGMTLSARGQGEGGAANSQAVAGSSKAVDWSAINITEVDKLVDGKNILKVSAIAPDGKAFNTQADIMGLFTQGDLATIAKKGWTAVIVNNFTNHIWSQMQIAGISDTCKKLGIKVLTSTDANSDIDKQVADLESAIQLKPNILFIKPIADEPLIDGIREAKKQGIKVVMIDTASQVFKAREDYVGMVQADNGAYSTLCIDAIAQSMGGSGEIAMLDFKYSIFHTDLRSKAAREHLKKNYPNIKIVAEQGIEGPDDAAAVFESMLTAHPNIKGVWGVWDSPAMSAASVSESLKKKVACSGPGISADSAYDMASGGNFIGGSNDFPYDMGVTEALMGIAAMNGKDVPPFVALPVTGLNKGNLASVWETCFHEKAPANVLKALGQ